jgi:hypothetical protein
MADSEVSSRDCRSEDSIPLTFGGNCRSSPANRYYDEKAIGILSGAKDLVPRDVLLQQVLRSAEDDSFFWDSTGAN